MHTSVVELMYSDAEQYNSCCESTVPKLLPSSSPEPQLVHYGHALSQAPSCISNGITSYPARKVPSSERVDFASMCVYVTVQRIRHV